MSGNLDVPLYRQVYQRVREEIAAGRLAPGTRLPSSRQFATDLGVSRLTVSNAYRALEADGIIVTRERSGTFVAAAPTGGEAANVVKLPIGRQPEWDAGLAAALSPRETMLRQVLASFGADDAVPFSWGAGDPAMFPGDEFRVIINRALRRKGAASLGAEHTEGNPCLRTALARYLQQLGIAVEADEVVVTTGSQQAISLVADVLLSPGDGVVVESPTWPGALEAFSLRGARLLPVPVDRNGMDIGVLEDLLARERPRLIYTVPTFHNPTGAVMSAERRRRLVTLARRCQVPVLEDDALREVRFGAPLPPPLASLDDRGNVINIGSFTKALLPAARIGYLSGPCGLREAVVSRKRWADMFCSPLMQIALAEYLESGQAVRFWKRCNRVYAGRQNAMLDALDRHMPASVRWHRVGGGPQMWLRLPDCLSVRALFVDAVEAGVPFAPGEAFFPEPRDQPYLRLNFAVVDEERIARGVAKLSALVRSALRGAGKREAGARY